MAFTLISSCSSGPGSRNIMMFVTCACDATSDDSASTVNNSVSTVHQCTAAVTQVALDVRCHAKGKLLQPRWHSAEWGPQAATAKPQQRRESPCGRPSSLASKCLALGRACSTSLLAALAACKQMVTSLPLLAQPLVIQQHLPH